LNLRKEYFDEIALGKTPEQARTSVGYKIYTGGILVIKAGALLLKGAKSAAAMG